MKKEFNGICRRTNSFFPTVSTYEQQRILIDDLLRELIKYYFRSTGLNITC